MTKVSLHYSMGPKPRPAHISQMFGKLISFVQQGLCCLWVSDVDAQEQTSIAGGRREVASVLRHCRNTGVCLLLGHCRCTARPARGRGG